jgi:hypothetical protein
MGLGYGWQAGRMMAISIQNSSMCLLRPNRCMGDISYLLWFTLLCKGPSLLGSTIGSLEPTESLPATDLLDPQIGRSGRRSSARWLIRDLHLFNERRARRVVPDCGLHLVDAVGVRCRIPGKLLTKVQGIIIVHIGHDVIVMLIWRAVVTGGIKNLIVPKQHTGRGVIRNDAEVDHLAGLDRIAKRISDLILNLQYPRLMPLRYCRELPIKGLHDNIYSTPDNCRRHARSEGGGGGAEGIVPCEPHAVYLRIKTVIILRRIEAENRFTILGIGDREM